MSEQSIPVVDLEDFHASGERRAAFVATVGGSLADCGFFAVRNHGIDGALTQSAYDVAREFFALDEATKRRYFDVAAAGQRGFTPNGHEHAKDSASPDLKEFYQIGRIDVPEDHPVHQRYGPNRWPQQEVPAFAQVMTELYGKLDALGCQLLQACALYLELPEDTFTSMVAEGDTILRVIHYPPLPDAVPSGSVRAAAHEDINMITLLSGATADGLELLTREGTWMPIAANHDEIIVDSGDMMQNVTNGVFKSTTHRVVNPADTSTDRYSMPCFMHPRADVDLSPMASCGEARYPKLTAGEFLLRRLREIGLM